MSSSGYTKSVDLLKKFSGKTKEIELTTDDGDVIKIKLFPLPNKYMGELLELQKFSNSLPKKTEVVKDKEVEMIDQDKCSSEDRIKLFDLNRRIVALSLVHSLKKENGEMTSSEFDTLQEMVDELPMTMIQQVITSISAINEVPLGQESEGDGQKKV
jgi:hypothetical protein